MAGLYTEVELPDGVSGEKASLLELLRDQRQMFEITLDGLSDEQAAQRSTVSTLTLSGLLDHLTAVEREMTTMIIERDEGSTIDPAGVEEAIRNQGTTGGGSLRQGLADYRAAGAAFDQIIVEGNLDELIPQPTAPWAPERIWWPIRQLAMHLLRETAHHCGHADIIRESLDGQTTTGALLKRMGISLE